MNDNSERFIPVFLTSEEKVKTLTGIRFQIRNLVVEIHLNIQRWNATHLQGISILKSIVDLKADKSYPEELMDLCSSLEEICEIMDQIVRNLRVIVDKMQSLEKLFKYKTVIFLTWSIDDFGKNLMKIYSAYEEEARVKRLILSNIAHQYDEARKMVYLTAWIYQALIPDDLLVKIEMMLIETGLRR